MAFRLLEQPGPGAPAPRWSRTTTSTRTAWCRSTPWSTRTTRSPAGRSWRTSPRPATSPSYRDRDAARVSMVLAALADGRRRLPADYTERTGRALQRRRRHVCPSSATTIDRHRELWADEDATLDASEAVLSRRPGHDRRAARRRPRRRHRADGHADAGGHRFGGELGQPASTRWPCTTRTERVVVATVRGRRYDVELRYEGWVQLRSRPLRLRRDLAPLAARLQDEETGDAVWTATPVSGLAPPALASATTRRARSRPTASSSCSSTTSPPPPPPGTPSPHPRRFLTRLRPAQRDELDRESDFTFRAARNTHEGCDRPSRCARPVRPPALGGRAPPVRRPRHLPARPWHRAVQRGALARVHRNVVRVGAVELDLAGRALAVQLALGSSSVRQRHHGGRPPRTAQGCLATSSRSPSTSSTAASCPVPAGSVTAELDQPAATWHRTAGRHAVASRAHAGLAPGSTGTRFERVH